MQKLLHAFCVFTGCALLLISTGCKTADFSAEAPRAGYGYMDIYTEPAGDVWWKVDMFDPNRQGFKEFVVQYEAPKSGILRIEARPGQYRAKLTLLNVTTWEPVEVEIAVREGMITPVKVSGTPAGESVIRSVQERVNRERMRIKDYPNQIWKLAATTESPVEFVPKERAAYYIPRNAE